MDLSDASQCIRINHDGAHLFFRAIKRRIDPMALEAWTISYSELTIKITYQPAVSIGVVRRLVAIGIAHRNLKHGHIRFAGYEFTGVDRDRG